VTKLLEHWFYQITLNITNAYNITHIIIKDYKQSKIEVFIVKGKNGKVFRGIVMQLSISDAIFNIKW